MVMAESDGALHSLPVTTTSITGVNEMNVRGN